MTRLLPAALALTAAGLGGPARAAADLDVDGRLRYRTVLLEDFPLDAGGFPHGHRSHQTALLRAGARVELGGWKLRVQGQLLDGQVLGDDSDLGGGAIRRPWRETALEDRARLREAWIEAPIGIGILRAGRMASHWGLGILANDGADVGPDGGVREGALFGDATHGDVSNRALLVTKPLRPFDLGRAGEALHLLVAGDVVEEDEITRREDGDLAWQAILALLWREEGLDLGVYAAHRDLEREDGATLRATALDLYGRASVELGGKRTFRIAGEAAVVSGETDELRFDGAPERLDVRQLGAVLRASLDRGACGALEAAGSLGLEIGFASGDNAAQDGTLRAFRFDPAYEAGLLLFEEVLGRTSARAYDRVTDPALSGTPPEGVERAPTQGSITNALYALPTVTGSLRDGAATGTAGALVAFSAGDVVDPYETALAGGYNRNAWGRSNASGLLGVELLLSLSSRVTHRDSVEVRIGAEGGLLLPGPALGAAGGAAELGTIGKVRLLTDVKF